MDECWFSITILLIFFSHYFLLLLHVSHFLESLSIQALEFHSSVHIYHYNEVSSRILVEIDAILGLLIGKKHSKELFKLRTLLILIEHTEYISLDRSSLSSRRSTLHSLYQIVHISPCIIHICRGSSAVGQPLSETTISTDPPPVFSNAA